MCLTQRADRVQGWPYFNIVQLILVADSARHLLDVSYTSSVLRTAGQVYRRGHLATRLLGSKDGLHHHSLLCHPALVIWVPYEEGRFIATPATLIRHRHV